MKNNVKFSLCFLLLAVSIYLLQIFYYNDYYRQYFTLVNFFLFYPSLILSVYFSLKILFSFFKSKERKNMINLVLSLPSIIFFLYFLFQAFKVIGSITE